MALLTSRGSSQHPLLKLLFPTLFNLWRWGIIDPMFKLIVYGCLAYMYVCAPCACSTYRGQKRALDFLGLELKVGVSSYVGARH